MDEGCGFRVYLLVVVVQPLLDDLHEGPQVREDSAPHEDGDLRHTYGWMAHTHVSVHTQG